MPYVPHDDETRRGMLDEIGVTAEDELFAPLPRALIRDKFDLPAPMAEPALARHMAELAAANRCDRLSFLGGGCYDHFIPAAVGRLAGQSQLYTAYTPYQPEVSQGTLAAIFEFQTYVAALAGMEVANASMYDGATAAAEAALMCLRLKKDRPRVLLAPNLHPEYRRVVETYLSNIPGVEAATLPCCAPYEPGGTVDLNRLSGALDGAACFVMQSPNFFGLVETDLAEIAVSVHEQGALLVVAVSEPMSLGVLSPPGAFGADVVVGEGQSFGMPPSFGGPGVGLFATREEFLRQMPGRLVGKTTDVEGKPGYVMTLQTREQHIRREKATSNICTNHALAATTFTIYLSLVGRSGLAGLARQNVQNCAYAQYQTTELGGYKMVFEGPVFNEFVLHCPKGADDVRAACLERGVDPGLPLGRFYPEYDDCLLITVTEKRTKADVDLLCEALALA
jgi:glycine dehydrogenase subunit 1